MNKKSYRLGLKLLALQVALAIFLMPAAAFAQTKISYHSNKYKPSDDVKLGREAAAQAEQQFPLLRDARVDSYVENVGQRLVAAIPPEFQHPEFRYYFKVLNASDINAFALPGGPMYVNRGMIQAARTEGEMAGVMAHELSHVALRHGTAQATKAQKYGLLAGILGVGGTILGGPGLGQLAQGTVGVYFLKFSREYETEADLLGARIMANAGYDPRDLANMFQTIQRQGGGGGGWFSDHPSPANRYERINQEAQYLQVRNVQRDNRAFIAVNERLRGYPRAQTMAEIQRSGRRYPNQGDPYPNGDRTGYGDPPRGRVDSPSSRFRNYSVLNVAQVSVPDNWREVSDSSNSIWFAPSGGYGSTNGQSVFTHGVNFGLAQTNSRNLQQATDELVNGLQQGNNNLRSRTGYQRTTIDGRTALAIGLNNVNEATGRQEIVSVVTTQLRNGELLYMIAVAPNDDFANYQSVFQNILRSMQVND
ncbi:MAG TPA: M48 family metallopeptidase [Pyrinomonadaceae bacterium]|nr:M48 family metallopeptidase [Pyrinomonadaceae bacterium]